MILVHKCEKLSSFFNELMFVSRSCGSFVPKVFTISFMFAIMLISSVLVAGIGHSGEFQGFVVRMLSRSS